MNIISQFSTILKLAILFFEMVASLLRQQPNRPILCGQSIQGETDIYLESPTVQASERKRSRDYKEATASAEALIAR